MSAPRIGITYPPFQPPENLRTIVRSAEAAGLDELWIWEDCFKQSGIAQAAAALAWSGSIPIGIGLLPAPLRNVALAAMEIATLERLFPGRLLPGIGHGVQSWMGQAGARVGSPLTLLREYGTAMRRLLAGERVTVSGRYVTLQDVSLDWPPAQAHPLLAGGSGPKSLALAAELGDGVILGGQAPYDRTAAAVETVRQARDSLGLPSCPVTTTLIAATGPDAEALAGAEATEWEEQPGDGVSVAGDAGAIADAVRRFGELGITTVSILPSRVEPDWPGLCRVLGQVKALLVE